MKRTREEDTTDELRKMLKQQQAMMEEMLSRAAPVAQVVPKREYVSTVITKEDRERVKEHISSCVGNVVKNGLIEEVSNNDLIEFICYIEYGSPLSLESIQRLRSYQGICMTEIAFSSLSGEFKFIINYTKDDNVAAVLFQNRKPVPVTSPFPPRDSISGQILDRIQKNIALSEDPTHYHQSEKRPYAKGSFLLTLTVEVVAPLYDDNLTSILNPSIKSIEIVATPASSTIRAKFEIRISP